MSSIRITILKIASELISISFGIKDSKVNTILSSNDLGVSRSPPLQVDVLARGALRAPSA